MRNEWRSSERHHHLVPVLFLRSALAGLHLLQVPLQERVVVRRLPDPTSPAIRHQSRLSSRLGISGPAGEAEQKRAKQGPGIHSLRVEGGQLRFLGPPPVQVRVDLPRAGATAVEAVDVLERGDGLVEQRELPFRRGEVISEELLGRRSLERADSRVGALGGDGEQLRHEHVVCVTRNSKSGYTSSHKTPRVGTLSLSSG